MQEMIFDLQRFAEVLHGKATGDTLNVAADKTQVYGLAGNDTLTSTGKTGIQLIGGSGNDFLNMTGGAGTLTGGTGKDTFNLSYSAEQTISAVIEDIDPTNDKIVIAYEGDAAPQLNSVISGSDVIWTDGNGLFNLTLKGSNDASDYYDAEGNEYFWEILRLTNQERENQNLPPLTMSKALTDGAAIRAAEIVNTFSHTRPDGTRYYTAINESYSATGENIASGQPSTEEVMTAWMNSTGHRENILRETFKKIGVGYVYDATAEYKENWVQMFGGDLMTLDTISTDDILTTEMEITISTASTPTDDTKLITLTNGKDSYTNTVDGVAINGLGGNDRIYNEGDSVTINGGAGNDTLRGGDGAEVFIYENKGGKDVIENYGAGDIISLGSGVTIKDAYTKGNNAVIKFKSGTITVKNSAEITLAQNGAETVFSNGVFIDDDTAKVYGSFNGTIDLGDNLTTADASLAKKKVTINGSAADNSLTGGKGKDKIYGNAGDDTLIGGKGKDSLWGGDGADTFIYAKGDGKDIIYGFGDDDALTLGNLNLKSGTLNSKGTEIYLKVGSTSKAITLKEFTATSFNINGSTYNISNKKLVLAS